LRELPAACAALGLPAARVHVVDSPQLQDGMAQRWTAEEVAACVGRAASDCAARTVVTFDALGVSGHPNHRDTHLGVLRWAQQAQGVACWVLRSPGWARKFTGPCLWPLEALGGVCFLAPTPWLARQALRAHQSQAIWYRSVFITLATLAYSNALLRVH